MKAMTLKDYRSRVVQFTVTEHAQILDIVYEQKREVQEVMDICAETVGLILVYVSMTPDSC